MKKIIKEKESNRKVFSTSEVLLLSIMSLLIGLVIGLLLNKTKIIKTESNDDKYISEFKENYEYIVNNYYEKVDKQSLIDHAIAGMTSSLGDPYSVYIDEKESSNFNITLNGSYSGVGIEIAEDVDKNIVVVSVFKNSSAEQAGIKPKDKILAINGKDVKGLSSSDVASEIRKTTSSIKLKYEQDGNELETTLVKKTISIPSIESNTYDIDNKKVGYIYISIFASNTYRQFKEALEKLEKENIDYLIIDVRSNSGGHLTSISGILDLFLNKNHIMYQFKEKNKVTRVFAVGKEKKNYKIILLGNEGSASASEVLISSLSENLNAPFIGKKTYGKGTVQELKELSDGTQYKITVKKWLTPKGNWINDTEGIVPNIEVDLDKKYFETYDENDDTQLQRAFEYIKEGK